MTKKKRKSKQSKEPPYKPQLYKLDEVVAFLKTSIRSTSRTVAEYEFYRNDNKDLYTFFSDREFNQQVKALQKQHKGSVLVASVETRIGARSKTLVKSTEFKVTHLRSTKFLGGKRKGRIWSAGDITAYMIHQSCTAAGFRLYKAKFGTDEERVISGTQGSKYRKEQTFTIKIQTYPKRFLDTIPGIEEQFIRFRKRRRAIAKAKQRARTEFLSVGIRRRKAK